jgi:hypothetical protein
MSDANTLDLERLESSMLGVVAVELRTWLGADPRRSISISSKGALGGWQVTITTPAGTIEGGSMNLDDSIANALDEAREIDP